MDQQSIVNKFQNVMISFFRIREDKEHLWKLIGLPYYTVEQILRTKCHMACKHSALPKKIVTKGTDENNSLLWRLEHVGI